MVLLPPCWDPKIFTPRQENKARDNTACLACVNPQKPLQGRSLNLNVSSDDGLLGDFFFSHLCILSVTYFSKHILSLHSYNLKCFISEKTKKSKHTTDKAGVKFLEAGQVADGGSAVPYFLPLHVSQGLFCSSWCSRLLGGWDHPDFWGFFTALGTWQVHSTLHLSPNNRIVLLPGFLLPPTHPIATPYPGPPSVLNSANQLHPSLTHRPCAVWHTGPSSVDRLSPPYLCSAEAQCGPSSPLTCCSFCPNALPSDLCFVT